MRMLPFVVNHNRNRLVQLTMTGSVGLGAGNARQDVQLVQTLLNAVPAQEAGPQIRLAVDGVAGPRTIGAIRRFQQARTRTADGRVDPGGDTIQKLVCLLNERNQLPQGLPNLGPPDPRIALALNGQGAVAPPVRTPVAAGGIMPVGHPRPTAVADNPNLMTQPMNWKIVTSGSFDVSIGPLGATQINIYMEDDYYRPGARFKFIFYGLGTGLSVLPFGIDYSYPDMPSWGTRLRKGYYGRNPCPADDFKGPASILTVGIAAKAGWSGTLILFGCAAFVLPMTRASGKMTGAQGGTPNAAITAYFGTITTYMLE
jgi:peptidoglycan hydrolase-like protein with peptidoglycan-binding domain